MSFSMDEHLRVRLNRGQREGLDRLIAQRGRNETVSDLVREIISTALGVPEGATHSAFSPEVQKILENLSLETNRTPDHVTADCISGIWGLVESGRSPLIVEEVKLRRRYRTESTSPVVVTSREMIPRTP
jgi:predicted DNA-binding protein